MKKFSKALLLLLLAITAFHLSGAEMAFCDDGSSVQATESHGCMACQITHHSAMVPQSAISYAESQGSFFYSEDPVMRLKEPARFILRPPITL